MMMEPFGSSDVPLTGSTTNEVLQTFTDSYEMYPIVCQIRPRTKTTPYHVRGNGNGKNEDSTTIQFAERTTRSCAVTSSVFRNPTVKIESSVLVYFFLFGIIMGVKGTGGGC